MYVCNVCMKNVWMASDREKMCADSADELKTKSIRTLLYFAGEHVYSNRDTTYSHT